jgi:hypothetical protein
LLCHVTSLSPSGMHKHQALLIFSIKQPLQPITNITH